MPDQKEHKILMVLTSCDKLKDGSKTGWYLVRIAILFSFTCMQLTINAVRVFTPT